MNENTEDFGDDSILYELLEYFVRKQEPELAKCKSDAATLPTTGTIKNALKYLNNRYSLPEGISQQIGLTLPWKFAVGDSGRLLAILQENLIEIRKAKDEYSSVVGKASVPKDAFPQWRKIAWSPDCSLLALASSNGFISFYNSLGNNVFNISPKNVSQNPHVLEAGDAIASMVFIKVRVRSPLWTYEFIAVTYSGLLKSYNVSMTDGFEESHEFSFGSTYRNGVTAVAYNEKHNLLFVAGNSVTQNISSAASETGLTSWRLLNDYPHYKLSFANDKAAGAKSTFSLWHFIPTLRSQPQSIIFKTSISPNGDSLACLHTDGSITIWSLPNLLQQRKWKLNEQPDFNAKHPLGAMKFKKFPPGLSEFHPLDINWWSEHSVIIARYSGSVSVCSINNLKNLLGASPEFLAGQPQISELCPERGFLSLDCETFLTSKKRSRDTNNEGQNSETSSESEREDDDQEPLTILSYATSLVQSTLYSITDMERFQPKRRKSRLLHRTYRILGLKSTTPEELYSRKIDIEEYGEALALARTYNLDTDLVYQTQWRKSEFSLNAIQDHLSKVGKRSWVLNECMSRVPETLEAARELLNFGLRGANLETLLAIGEKDDGKFTVEETEDDWTDLDESQLNLRQVQKENEILEKLDMEKLTEGQKDLVRYRRKLLDHLDKLQTYEIILESPTMYNKDFYEEFRQLTAVENAVRFAKDSNSRAVDIMFTYHGEKLSPHWLPIISYFPETLNPLVYAKLLPECDSEGQLFLLDRQELRQKDWSERSEFSKVLDLDSDDGSQYIYDSDPALSIFRNIPLTQDLLQKWFKTRAYQIERDSYMVDNALSLIEIGKTRNINGLEGLLLELQTLDDLTYKVYVENMSLARLEKLTDLEKVSLLMSKSDELNFVGNIKDLVMPFIYRKENYSGGQSHKWLLHDYLIRLSEEDLALPAILFEYLKRTGNSEIVENPKSAVTLALDCIYACRNPDMYEKARDIFNCISPVRSVEDTMSLVHDSVEEFERELDCVRILRQYNTKTTLSYIKENKTIPEAVKLLLIQMARSLNKITPPPGENAWAQMLNDMLDIHGTTFSCLDIEICFEICVSARLVSGIKTNIQNCANLIETQKREQSLLKVSYKKAIQLILQASTEYFNSSESLTDSNMELAKACLHLITDDNSQIREEYDLIDSLQILNEFNVNVLPLQVRLSQDRLSLINSCLNSREDAYKSTQRLLTLANYLRVEKSNTRNREGKVLGLIAQKAYEAGDYDVCASTCKRLTESNYSPAWQIVLELGNCDGFQDLQFRQKCLWFSMNCGPNDLLEDTLKRIHLLEMQILHNDLQKLMPVYEPDEYENAVDSDDEFTDAMTTPQVESKEFVPKIIGTSTEIVKSSADLVRRSTYSVMRNVGNRDFWKKTLNLNFIGAAEKQALEEDEILTVERESNLQSFPCFYQSLHERCKVSQLDTKYTKYSMQDVNNDRLKLCQTLLRVSLLGEAACYGMEASDVNHLLLECAQHTILEDCLLGLSYLMGLPHGDSVSAQKVFSDLPRTDTCAQLAAYFFSLELYKKLNQEVSTIYLHDPIELIKRTMILAKNLEDCDIQKALLYWEPYLFGDKSYEAESMQQANLEDENPAASSSLLASASKERPELYRRSSSTIDAEVEDVKTEVEPEVELSVKQEVPDKFKVETVFSQPEEEVGWDEDWGDFSDHNDEGDESLGSSIPETKVQAEPKRNQRVLGRMEDSTEESRFAFFMDMFSTVKSKSDYLKVRDTLLSWPKFTNSEFTTLENHPALRMVEIAKSYFQRENSPDDQELLLEYKKCLDGQVFPNEMFVNFLKRQESSYALEEKIFLRLCSNDTSLQLEAVNIIKEKYQELNLSAPILTELFFRNLTLSFDPNHTVYNQILDEVFENHNLTDIRGNVKLLIMKLVENRCVPHAASLLNRLESVPPSLRTFDTGLYLLREK